jgi:molybdopterin synthase catalytic subunit
LVVRVQEADFDPGAEIAAATLGRDDVGAVASFVGLVRGFGGGRRIHAMTLEHYPGMTERELERIEAEACTRWPLQSVTIVHRHGRLVPGDRIVLVVTTSAHRQAAFDACAFLMDWLKTRAPFWKLEETDDGAEWVAAKATDDAAADRWGN